MCNLHKVVWYFGIVRQAVGLDGKLCSVYYLFRRLVGWIRYRALGDCPWFTNLHLPSNIRIMLYDSQFVARRGTIDHFHLSYYYEPEVTDRILTLASSSSGIFIDVGAHIGRYTVLAAKRLGSRGKVLAFEPNPETFKALQQNVKLNSLDNVVLFNLALGDRNTTMDLYIDTVNDGATSLLWGDGPAVTVPVRRLDDILAEQNIDPREVFLIKVDVEGAEPLVFKGAERLLREGSPTIIFEALTEEKLRECKSILKKLGYVVEPIDSSNYIAKKHLRDDRFLGDAGEYQKRASSGERRSSTSRA